MNGIASSKSSSNAVPLKSGLRLNGSVTVVLDAEVLKSDCAMIRNIGKEVWH